MVFERTKGLFSLEARRFEEIIPVAEDDIEPCAQRTVETQRSRDIRFCAIVVPGSTIGTKHSFVGGQRTLANNIHAGARISYAAKQRIRTAQHFDLVIFA